jgi:hypothetical protein
MPFQPILPTWLSLNGANFTSPTALTDIRTGQPFAAGGLNVGDFFDLTTQEASQLSNTSVGTLQAGRYRFIQVDSAATAANVATGTIGLMKASTSANVVTSYDIANLYLTLNTPRKVVFLNAITPGNYGFVQELGVATVQLKTGLGNGAPAIGNVINITSTGADDPTSQTLTQAQVGTALTLPASAAMIQVGLTAPSFQD